MRRPPARLKPSKITVHAPSPAAVLHIDLAALAVNFGMISDMTGPSCRVAAVVKADSYGLGVGTVVPALEKRGCGFYFVATPEEGFALRALTQKPAGILNGTLPGGEDDIIGHNLWPVLNSLADIELWRAAAQRHNRALPVILHFDTGMNRLGLARRETETLLDNLDLLNGLDVKIVMSHFACADQPDHPMTARQYDLFKTIAARFPRAQKSLAASSGLFRNKDFHFDMVRPGMALYGLNPLPDRKNPAKPVISLQAPVLQVKTVDDRESVGYGASCHFEKDGVVLATVALGYADGFLRALGNRGVLYYNGRPCPVRGRVSMDLVTVEMDQDIAPGAMLEVIGPHQSADDLAAAAGTIGYEILTSLGTRYRRIYSGD